MDTAETEKSAVAKPKKAAPVRLLWTLQDFMLATGFSRSFIYTERERGNIVLRKAAGRTVILKEDVEAYLSKLEIAA